MVEDCYFDTSMWLDIHEKRGSNGENAKKLMEKIIRGNYTIAYSDLTIIEFKQLNYSQNEINQILSAAKPDNLRRIHIYKEQVKEATKLARQRDIPKKDAVHAILCRDNFLQLISRDEHFEKLKDITNTKKPEEII